MAKTDTTTRFVREPERRQITGIGPTTWRVWEEKGFAPRRVRIGPRMIGWLRSELADWEETRSQVRGFFLSFAVSLEDSKRFSLQRVLHFRAIPKC